ncbi:MAG: uroporphyrinogen-III C-methyltransferase [Rhodospirillales bacterium]|nr:uroporphyrinogen-III C-methyltransferase [Rhodospirillales bacterium]
MAVVNGAFAPGSVWLVGAGPGDPGLLTLHAAQALAEADVVLHDALISPEILALARGRLESVGKRAGGRRTPQLRIQDRLIVLARQGLRVLRLKGGDPLLFGRGGEEAVALAAAGIAFRVVPGISAASGAAAAAGMPLTHRTLARSVAFATGHDADGRLPEDPDLAVLGCAVDTLVMFMPLRQAPAIAATLLAGGRDPATPAALISDATTPRQVVRRTTLAQLPAAAAAVPRAAPTLLVLGPTVTLADRIGPPAAADATSPGAATPVLRRFV